MKMKMKTKMKMRIKKASMLFKKLNLKLDALTHFNFAPKCIYLLTCLFIFFVWHTYLVILDMNLDPLWKFSYLAFTI
ncbi:hypothetical protein Lalb_Chr25g0281331 [Lupinus albus]|uniref:Uncharacterized protein n=1 Tax=Lupinus albus TaxID=3870 RepID=A0A6A4NDM3_LUPAL|nr:hypothetical protein Lalb_Chr25g0281331 [Lupinus albus]